MSHHHPPTRMSHFVCEKNMFAKWIKSTVQHMFKRSIHIHIHIHIHIYIYIKLVVSTQLKCILVKLDHFRKCLNPQPKQCIPLKIHVFFNKIQLLTSRSLEPTLGAPPTCGHPNFPDQGIPKVHRNRTSRQVDLSTWTANQRKPNRIHSWKVT